VLDSQDSLVIHNALSGVDDGQVGMLNVSLKPFP
jgi:hypothetical protein